MPPITPFNTMLLAQLPRLKAYALSLTHNRAAADDLLQETAYKALRAWKQFVVGTNFAAWTHCIMRNEFYSSFRRKKNAAVRIDDQPDDLLAKPANQEEIVFSYEIMRVVERLSPAHSRVVDLVCGGGLSYEEASHELKCSVNTIKSRLWRAREKISKLTSDGSHGISPSALSPTNRCVVMAR